MSEQNNYNIDLDVKYNHQELIDIPAIVGSVKEKWSNRTLTKVNDSVVRLGIVEGEFHWHKHDNDDEFFFVLSGTLCIDIRENGSNTQAKGRRRGRPLCPHSLFLSHG